MAKFSDRIFGNNVHPDVIKIFDNLKSVCDVKPDAAIIAPTIITDEIALVTDIKGVCKEGVTLRTT